MDTVTVHKNVSLSLAWFIALATLAVFPFISAQAEEFEAKAATLPAPQMVAPPDVTAMPPPMSQSEGDDRQSKLGTHHRPTPMGPVPPDVLALPAPTPPAQSTPAPQAIVLPFARNHALTDAETQNATSTVNEPSVAVTRRDEVLVTGNWFASFSTDGGVSFTYVNPAGFPAIAGRPNVTFCCDQVAIYDPDEDLMIWFLQYVTDATGNVVRLAVAQGADIASQQWRLYDFTPQGVGGWNNEWFDYPDLALGDDNLYVTTNTFSTTGGFTRAVILRIPLSELANYQALNFNFWDTSQNGSLRLVQGAGNTMFFASHNSVASLRVFSWPEAANTITTNDVVVTAWPNTGARPGWTSRSDSRITAAWLSGNQLGFGWTASVGTGFPHPHARMAIIDLNTMAIIAEPHLWNQNFPFAYPAAAPNGAGRVAIGVHFGANPNHALGVLETANTPPTWNLVTTATGTNSPASNLWGDYTSVRVHGSDPQTWVATGFTLQGGSNRTDIQTRYIHFSENLGTQVAIQVQDPGNRLHNGETMWVRATVTTAGSPAPNKTVTFTSSSTDLTVAPNLVQTNTLGEAEATLTSHAGWFDLATVTVTAEADGVTAQTPVKVPDISMVGFVLILLVVTLLLVHRRRRMLG